MNAAPTYLVNKWCARLTGNAAVTYAAGMSKSSKPPVQLYSALADATRCKILTILQKGPIPVHTLADAFTISRPAISRHLRVLKSAGLVAEVKKGRENLYAFKPAKLERGRAWIELMSGRATASEVAEVAPEIEVPVESGVAEPQAQVEVPTPVVVKAKPRKKAEPKAKPVAMAETSKPAATEPSVPAGQMGFDF